MPRVIPMPGGRTERVAVYGTTKPTKATRAAYQQEHDLTYAGTPEEVAAYVATLEEEIAAAPAPAPTWGDYRAARDRFFTANAWVIQRHATQQILDPADRDITDAEYVQICQRLQELRDAPTTLATPADGIALLATCQAELQEIISA